MDGNSFLKVQRLGQALMLPIAVLPVAGILLRIGQPDIFNVRMIADAGGAIFDNLPLLFAIGVAIGFAKDNNGVAALAGAIGYFVEIAVMKDINATLNMGVLAGIVAGLVAGLLYNRYKDIKLPDYLSFFGGKRFVPIITGLVCVVLGFVFGHAWLPVQGGINAAGHWLTTAGATGAFVFGVLNRLLAVTGLHHVMDSLVWFVFGSFTPADGGAAVTGDLHRFFAGDPTAGDFMTGFFPIFMFGLPATCFAMLHEARKERRAAVGGMLISMALASCLTGVTEPVEFTFMFLAPALYLLHAVLTGLSMAICTMLGIKLGFTFSAGAIDYVLGFGLSTKGWEVIPIGIAYGLAYYGLFRFFIRRFNLPTPGREPIDQESESEPFPVASDTKPGAVPAPSRADQYIKLPGSTANLNEVTACETRLRLHTVDSARVSVTQLETIGASAVPKHGDNQVHIMVGPEADFIADDICKTPDRNQSGDGDAVTRASGRPILNNRYFTPGSSAARTEPATVCDSRNSSAFDAASDPACANKQG